MTATIRLIPLLLFLSLPAFAASDLDQDCRPRGWIQQFHAWWDPRAFWSVQEDAIRIELAESVRSSEIHRQLQAIQERADAAVAVKQAEIEKIEQASDEAQRQVMGIKSKPPSPELKKSIEDSDKFLAKTNVQMEALKGEIDASHGRWMVDKQDWSAKCTLYAREQLAKTR